MLFLDFLQQRMKQENPDWLVVMYDSIVENGQIQW